MLHFSEFRKVKDHSAAMKRQHHIIPQQKLLIGRFYAGSVALTECCEAASCHVASLLNAMQMTDSPQRPFGLLLGLVPAVVQNMPQITISAYFLFHTLLTSHTSY